jgi:hypothetical protein
MAEIVGDSRFDITPERALGYASQFLDEFSNVRIDGRYWVGDRKEETVDPEGALYVSHGSYFATPGYSVRTGRRDGSIKVAAVLKDSRAAHHLAKLLNNVHRCTQAQLACKMAGKFGRTSPVGFAPVGANCPECGAELVGFFGPYMSHPSISAVPEEYRNLIIYRNE